MARTLRKHGVLVESDGSDQAVDTADSEESTLRRMKVA